MKPDRVRWKPAPRRLSDAARGGRARGAAAPLGAALALAVCLTHSGCGLGDEPPPVLVIGLDGATFEVLDPLFEQGLLPNLAALRERGTEGVLETVSPAISPPAWTSATTGVNPGKHNVYDFFHVSKTSPQPFLTSALDRRARPVWWFLNRAGYRTGILNIPMTFPPDGVDGFFISGFPFGQATTGFTYPKELEEELGEYPLDLFGESLPAGRERELLDHFRHTFERHQTVAKRLLTEKDWDLFWVVFTGTDKVQHYYWKFSDPKHPGYDPVLADEFGTAIRDFFVRVDEVVGEFVAAAGPECNVIVLSDHGFGPIYEELRLFQWLRDEGFIVPDPANPQVPLTLDAYAPGAFGGLLRVSLLGRDFQGRVPPEEAAEVRERLKERLAALVDPETGEPFAERIFVRDELYHGPYVENAPDVVFLERSTRFVGRAAPSGDLFGPPSYTFSGYHRPEGILLGAGPSIGRSAERGTFSILDIAPTIYWLFDVALPNDLDGDVAEGFVRGDLLDARPVQTSSESAVILPENVDELSAEEREVLESHGYVR